MLRISCSHPWFLRCPLWFLDSLEIMRAGQLGRGRDSVLDRYRRRPETDHRPDATAGHSSPRISPPIEILLLRPTLMALSI